jgi:CubicO group peptidase (beta-lactamase class C family)
MDAWQRPAVDYIVDWLGFQMRLSEQPGCILAIAHRDKIVAEHAFGVANLATGERLTPRHRFRIASHSKAFTAAGVMRLREQRKLRLDDPVGDYVAGLHPAVASATLAQLMSHSAGLVRDGLAGGQFSGDRPFVGTDELLADLAAAPPIDPGSRFKYSNHGYGLLGLVIEAISDEPYRAFIAREVIAAAGLKATRPDMPLAKGTPFAQGHSAKLPAGRRLVIPGGYQENAIAPAGGVVSTAADVARFFAQLAPNAKRSLLTAASRREMVRKHWRNPDATLESYYGLGIMSGSLAGWDCFGHGGGLQGYISRTCVIPACELTISILTNATDGWAGQWVEGAMHILRAFASRGAPQRGVRDWTGRWWSNWGAFDLVPIGNRVLIGNPHAINPFMDATETEVSGRDNGKIVLAAGYGSHGEPVRRVRGASGKVTGVRLAGGEGKPERVVAAKMLRRYGARRRKSN